MSQALEHVADTLPVLGKTLRIAVVTETYPPEINGVARTVARFVRGLHDRQHELQLIRPRQGGTDCAQSSERFNEILQRGVSIPNYPDLKMGLPARRALTRRWTTERPDIVHIVTEGPLGWSALKAATQLGIPVSSDFRTNFHVYSSHYGIGWLNKPIAAYLRKFHNDAALTLVPTDALRRDLQARGFRNLQVVARGVDTALFDPLRRSDGLRRQWGADARTPVAIHVGRLAAEKNMQTLEAAFDAIRSAAPRARLVVVGAGPAADGLRARCPDVHFAGVRTGEDLAAHYASGDMFLFPSLTETFGNVTLEAMASGLAVVAFDYAAAAEHIRHGDNGVLVGLGDAEGFARAAAALATQHARMRALGAQARMHAATLAWDKVVGSFESLLMGVAQSHPMSRAALRP